MTDVSVAREFKSTASEWTFDLQFASYRPRIDSQFESGDESLRPPYETAFGNDGDLLFTIAVERHLWSGFGTLSLGAAGGYWNAEGKSIPADNATTTDAEDSTEMSIFPFFLQATYRLDKWADVIPFAPVGRIGFDYYYWRIYNGADEVAEFGPGKPASGGTMGWHAAVGIHILLDYLARDMAYDFERDAGVENTYLTLEYRFAQVDDFGSASSFRLGDDTFFIGLALEL